MYTEGIKLGTNSYLLSDEDGELTLLNGTGTQEEIEEYIKLENKHEEKMDEISSLKDKIYNINNKNRISKRINRIIAMSVIFTEVILVLLGALSQEPLKIFGTLVITPVSITILGNVLKIAVCGTPNKRTKCKLEIENKINKEKEELKEIMKNKNKLKEKIEKIDYFWEDEIIPVTTEENKKANVKMRVLKLEEN